MWEYIKFEDYKVEEDEEGKSYLVLIFIWNDIRKDTVV